MKIVLFLFKFLILKISFGQNISSHSEAKESVMQNEFKIQIKDESNIELTKYSIIVYKDNKVFQHIITPKNMDKFLPFDRRFFTAEDVNFDGYKDLYFTDFIGKVNSSKIVYLYNPSSEKFILNEDFRSITSPQFDINYQIIKSFNQVNSAHYETENYIILDEELTRISKSIENQGVNKYKYTVYDGEDEVAINETLRKVKLYIGFFKTDKFNIIIDLLDNGKYRYSSWSTTKNLKNSPDLILKNGMKKESIDKITYEFKNGEFTYLCTFNKLKNNGYLKVIQNQKELVQKKASVFIIPNELKKYIGIKNMITITLK
tara:strand:+ start:600 stop:1550 length:951 start_codon:yes stop_codon:yes gene_type:complete